MARKRFTADQIIIKLREAEVSDGLSDGSVCRRCENRAKRYAIRSLKEEGKEWH